MGSFGMMLLSTELGVTGWFHLKETFGTMYTKVEKLKSKYNGKVGDRKRGAEKKKKKGTISTFSVFKR